MLRIFEKLLIIFLLTTAIANNSLFAVDAKRYTIVILFHLYDIGLMNEFIGRINKFIKCNNQEDFYIKINIPVTKNIERYHQFDDKINNYLNIQERIYEWCIKNAPYHPSIITKNNCLKLYCIALHLKDKLCISPDKFQIIFSENRGADIGGFFLLLDQLIQEKMHYNYIIKLHTKKNENWRNKLLAILDLDLKKHLPRVDCIYPCRWLSDKKSSGERVPRLILQRILKSFNASAIDEFYFAAGSMFVASHHIADFFKKFDRIKLFNQLNVGYRIKNELIEHAYERLFGYLAKMLNLKVYFCNVLTKKDLKLAYGKIV